MAHRSPRARALPCALWSNRRRRPSDDRRGRTAAPADTGECVRAKVPIGVRREPTHPVHTQSGMRKHGSGGRPRQTAPQQTPRGSDAVPARRPAADRVQLPAAPHSASLRPRLAPSGAEGALRYAPAPGATREYDRRYSHLQLQLPVAVRVRTLTRGSLTAVRAMHVRLRTCEYRRLPLRIDRAGTLRVRVDFSPFSFLGA